MLPRAYGTRRVPSFPVTRSAFVRRSSSLSSLLGSGLRRVLSGPLLLGVLSLGTTARAEKLRGVIDFGSGACRAAVFGTDGNVRGYARVFHRLGKMAEEGKPLSADALRHGLETVRTLKGAMRMHGELNSVRAGLTAWARRPPAESMQPLLDGLRDVFGITARILSGEQEARAGTEGALAAWPSTRLGQHRLSTKLVTIDTGNGSHQVTLVENGRVTAGGSTQVGAKHVVDAFAAVADSAAQEAALRELVPSLPEGISSRDVTGRTALATGGLARLLQVLLGQQVVTTETLSAMQTRFSGAESFGNAFQAMVRASLQNRHAVDRAFPLPIETVRLLADDLQLAADTDVTDVAKWWGDTPAKIALMRRVLDLASADKISS